MKLSALLENIESDIATAAFFSDMDEAKVIDLCKSADPSKGTRPKYFEWIARQLALKNIELPRDNHKVYDTIFAYHNWAVCSNALNKPAPDIMEFTDLIDLRSTLDNRKTVHPDASIVGRSEHYLLLRIGSIAAAKYHGKGAAWVNTPNSEHDESLYHLVQYYDFHIIVDKSTLQPFAAFDSGNYVVTDINDNPIELNDELFNLVIGKSQTAESACNWARTMKRRVPHLENIIMTDGESASRYACDILKKRWPEAESVIAKYPWGAIEYAARILKTRWPEIEDGICRQPCFALEYINSVIKGRWPEAEPMILRDPNDTMQYFKILRKYGKAGRNI